MNPQHDTASPRPDHSLYRDVYQRLRSEILDGRLAAGARLPSSRTLASQLGVARGTVEVAYQMLAGEGYTIAAGARGTMVNPALSLRRRTRPAAKPESRAQRLRFPPGPLLFQMGLPALDVFPRKQWSQIATRVVRSVDVEQLAHPHDILGYEPLRQAIASYLRIARDIACTADQIMITAGFQGALGFIIQALLAPRDEVWVDDPGYFFAHELLRGRICGSPRSPSTTRGSTLRPTRGSRPTRRSPWTPSHQFPLGMTLPRSIVVLRCSTGPIASAAGSWRTTTIASSTIAAAAAGAQEPRSLRTRSLRRVVQQGAVSRIAAGISCRA